MKCLQTAFALFLSLSLLIHAQDAPVSPDLPDLPDVQNTPTKETSPLLNVPSTPAQSTSATPYNPRISREQIDKAQTDKNWLLEGLKEKELEADIAREEALSEKKSIIDEILQKNQSQISKRSETVQDSRKLKAALSTSAWEPLPDITSSSYQETLDALNNTENPSQPSFKKVDEKTGISNVFFNPATGTFGHEPVNNTRNRFAQNPSSSPSLPSSGTLAIQNSYEEEKARALEAKLIEATEIKNNSLNDSSLSTNENPLDLLASNTNTTSPSAINSNLQHNPGLPTTQVNYSSSVARLKLLEDERQRKLKANSLPQALEIHGPFKAGKIEVNPRF